MPKSYTNLLYHIIFSTRDRRPIITPHRRTRLYDYVGGIIREVGGISLAIGGIADHLHLLAKLRADRALSDTLRDLKANSTGWMHDVFPDAGDFYWQKGYGAFTVSTSHVPAVSAYINDQERHHQNRSFRDEFVEILRVNGVEYDERYLWS
jgi:REP element-mobilizing transposase RayT